MSHKNTAFNQIKRYGFKGAAVLNVKTKTSDKSTKRKSTIAEVSKPLLAYVGRYNQSKIVDMSIEQNSYKIMAALDSDFDGSIGVDDTVTIDGVELAITRFTQHKINQTIAYVEIITNG